MEKTIKALDACTLDSSLRTLERKIGVVIGDAIAIEQSIQTIRKWVKDRTCELAEEEKENG